MSCRARSASCSADLFAQERTQIRIHLIDEQPQLLLGASSADYATARSTLLWSAARAPRHRQLPAVRQAPSAVMLAGGSSETWSRPPLPASARRPSSPPRVIFSPDTASDARPPLPARRLPRAALGALAATGVAIVPAALTLIVRHSLEPSTSPVPRERRRPRRRERRGCPPAVGARSSRASPAGDGAAGRSAVSPAAARDLDRRRGAPDGRSLHRGRFLATGARTSIRVEAPGFETKLLSLSADKSRTSRHLARACGDPGGIAAFRASAAPSERAPALTRPRPRPPRRHRRRRRHRRHPSRAPSSRSTCTTPTPTERWAAIVRERIRR